MEIESQKLVIGLIGRPGSGKAICAAELLKLAAASDISAEKITFSDLLGQTLDEYGVERNRSNLQQLAIFIQERRAGGLGYRMRNIVEHSLSRLTIVDGLRWREDFEMVKSFPNAIIIYLTAPQDARFARLKNRGQKPGESEMSFEDFVRSESVATETAIEALGKEAEVEMANDGSVEEFADKLDQIWKEQIAPLLTR